MQKPPNSFKTKLAFFDLDGTIIGRSGLVSPRTKKAISDLRNNSVQIAIATGRPMFGALEIAKALDVDCISLFSSGALIANPKDRSTFFEASLSIEEINSCVNTAKELGLYIELYTKDHYYIESETKLTEQHQHYLKLAPTVGSFSKIIGKLPINKIVTISDSPELEQAQALLIDKMPTLSCMCSKGANHPEILFNNICSKAASRAKGFELITSHLKVKSEEVIAFGDSVSDQTFIELAGIGVAMIEAPDQVKEVADIIADSVEEDGVAKVIEDILFPS